MAAPRRSNRPQASGLFLPMRVWDLPTRLFHWALVLLVLTILAASVLAAVHTGVEFHWWPSPFPECAAPKFSGATIAERLTAMPAMPAKPCDDPTYLIPFVPVSMAAMNFLFSLAFAGFVSLALRGKVQAR